MTTSHRRFSRREALVLVAGALAGLALPPAVFADAAPAPLEGPALADFVAFCDTLIPADALAPAASALGVPARILAVAGSGPLFRRLLDVSQAWLVGEAGGVFADVDDADRERAVAAMAALPWEAPPRRFFELIRELAMGYYWSQPAAWKGLATDHPPQPAGYFEAVR